MSKAVRAYSPLARPFSKKEMETINTPTLTFRLHKASFEADFLLIFGSYWHIVRAFSRWLKEALRQNQ